jgi:hypothetical protein
MAPWVLTTDQNVPIDVVVMFPECTGLDSLAISSRRRAGWGVVYRPRNEGSFAFCR